MREVRIGYINKKQNNFLQTLSPWFLIAQTLTTTRILEVTKIFNELVTLIEMEKHDQRRTNFRRIKKNP